MIVKSVQFNSPSQTDFYKLDLVSMWSLFDWGVNKTHVSLVVHWRIGGDNSYYRSLLKMTGCRIVECKQLQAIDKKSNSPLPHNTEKSFTLVYYTQIY